MRALFVNWRPLAFAVGLLLSFGALDLSAHPILYTNSGLFRPQGSDQMSQSHPWGYEIGVGYGVRISSRLWIRPMLDYAKSPLDSKWAMDQISSCVSYAGVVGGRLDLWTASISGVFHFKDEKSRLLPSVFANIDYFWLTYRTIYSVSQAGEKLPWQGPFERVYGNLGFGFGGSLSLKLTSFLNVFVERQWVFGTGHSPAVTFYSPARLGVTFRP